MVCLQDYVRGRSRPDDPHDPLVCAMITIDVKHYKIRIELRNITLYRCVRAIGRQTRQAPCYEPRSRCWDRFS